jgi:hypothetical protein
MLKFTNQSFPLQGATLLISGLSPGGAPTLALDGVIVQCGFKRVAYFHTKCVEPSVGYLPEDIEGGALGLSSELYVKGDVALLQFRSAVRVGRRRELAA